MTKKRVNKFGKHPTDRRVVQSLRKILLSTLSLALLSGCNLVDGVPNKRNYSLEVALTFDGQTYRTEGVSLFYVGQEIFFT